MVKELQNRICIWASVAKAPHNAQRDGVILMETLLVLPLLLMLLGGMFLLGDLVLGRIVLQDAGRHEAWLTHCTRMYPSTKDSFKFAESDHVFKLTKAESKGFRPSDGGVAGGNSWGWGRSGYAAAKSELPLWTALINTQHDVMNQEGERMGSEFKMHDDDSLFAQSFDYHRIDAGDAAALGYDMNAYERSNPAIGLEETLIAGDVKFARPGALKGDAHGQRTAYQRSPSMAALAQ